ncbi:MAG TPA: hypothetical protein VGL82_01920 [Bryobacteraceae bacterium]
MRFSRARMLWAGLAAVCASGLAQVPQTPAFSTGQAARLIMGQTNFTAGNYGATSSLLGALSGLAYANGTLWVADANRLGGTPNNNRVLRFSDVATYPGPTEDPTIVGSLCGVCRGQASLVLGQPDFVSNNFTLTATGLRSPTAVATDGNILAIADTDNNRVLIWLSLPRANAQPADVVIGQADFTHNATSVPPTATSLRGPSGVWIAGGKLYVADTGDNRILIYNKIPLSNHVAADVVVGQPSFTSFVQPDLTQNNATPTASDMQTPVSVTTDATHMYVADEGQNRVLIWNTIPTSNGAPADVALGQLNLTTAISNNSFTINDATADADGAPENVTPVMCQSTAAFAYDQGQTGTTAVDSVGTTIYPSLCAATMSLPRYALSDGTRLFVADGGNDRILVYNSIPTQSGQPADAILGEPDEFSDNTGTNPDGTNALQTPTSMAFDGLNLYVSDTYNRRVVIYTPGMPNIPIGGQGILNAASLNIYAIGDVALGGSINAKDTITITIDGKDYAYTIVTADTPQTITDALVNLINKGPDPNVIASANDQTDQVVLTARTPGAPGANVTLAVTTSANAQITGSASGSTLNLYLQNPTSIAPGTLIEVNGQNLCDSTAIGNLAVPYVAVSLAGCQVFVDGVAAPLLYVSPTQINTQLPFEFTDRTSVSVYARNTHADGSVSVTSPVAVTVVPQNPGIFAEYGPDPRPGIVYHGSSSAIDVLQFNGGIQAGDVANLTIGSNAYSYTVLSTDTLLSVAQALAGLINGAPDPNVTASAANLFESLVLSAITPGPAGEGITVAQSVTGTSPQLAITVYNPSTCCDNTYGALVTGDNPAVPGEIVYLYATGLGATNPANIYTGEVTPVGDINPPLTPVDSILNAGTSANILSATLVPGLMGVYMVSFELSDALTTNLLTQTTIAQQAFVSNVVTFPVVAPPTSSSTSSAVRRPIRGNPVAARGQAGRQR